MHIIPRLVAYTLICALVNYAAQLGQSSAGLIFFWPGNALAAMLAMHWRSRCMHDRTSRLGLFMLLYFSGHYTASLLVQQHMTALQQLYACLVDTLSIPLYALYTQLVLRHRRHYRTYMRSILLVMPITLTAITQGIIAGTFLTGLIPLGTPGFVTIDWTSEQIFSGLIISMLLYGILSHKRSIRAHPPRIPMLLLIVVLVCAQVLMVFSDWLSLVTILVLPSLIALIHLGFTWTILITGGFMLLAAASRIHFYITVYDYRQGNALFHEIFSNRFDFAMTAILIIVMAELMNRNRQLMAHIKAKANTDPLTRLCNRRALLQAISRHSGRQNLGIAILDVDNFKAINDRYGHDVGDRVLMKLSEILRHRVRSQDLPARWGGEEFVVIFPDIPPASFPETCQRIIKAIREQPLMENDDPIPFTVSMGSVFISKFEAGHFEQAIVFADGLLYQAKQTGKNKAIVEMNYLPELSASPAAPSS
ncbi:GGDEF domain-containing protein [Corticimicrobacter populi]|uniref:diguanylate cyclase n=1 Tax=Corticimicrobacter populi TaxID=2175229 RepID=A0A2V1JZ60_9BURK|nr:GGDEF domain-containing protein [Corticimicrobacter populi]PWF22569.1 hypothetical protein DD235_10815 [Corticimicrobacter populi]